MNTEQRLAVLTTWAKQNRCRLRKDECGDKVIFGRNGLVREYGERLRIIYIPEEKEHNREQYRVLWENRRDKLQAAGCEIRIDAHGEGVALFDPRNYEQSQLAIRVAGIRQKRRFNPDQMKALAARGRAMMQARRPPEAITA